MASVCSKRLGLFCHCSISETKNGEIAKQRKPLVCRGFQICGRFGPLLAGHVTRHVMSIDRHWQNGQTKAIKTQERIQGEASGFRVRIIGWYI